MGRKRKRKKFNQWNRQRSIDTAAALWDSVTNRQNPNAMRVLVEVIGLDKIVLLLILKDAGHRTIDAEAVAAIAASIERTQVGS